MTIYSICILVHMKIKHLIMAGLLWAAVSYNMGVVTFTTKNIIDSLGISRTLAGMLVSITLVGWFFGSLVFGYASDRYGRKKIVIIASTTQILATGAMAFSHTYSLFLALRFIAGMGFGMVLPVLSAWVSESAMPENRGRMVVLLDSFWTYGWVAASLAAYLYLPAIGENWQSYYLLAFIWLIFVPLAMKLPEVKIAQEKQPINALLKYRHTYALWGLWFAMAFSYYGIFVWLPRIFATQYPVMKSYEFIFLTYLAQIPGYFTAAYLVEKIGRRWVIFSYMLITGLSAYLFITNFMALSLSAAFLLSFFDLGAWGALYAITPELYPKNLKGTGAGAASSVGRIGGIIGPLIPGFMPWLSSFAVFTILLIGAAFLAFLLPETKGITPT